MTKIKAVVFDFDGVLTKGGEELKEKAWDFLSDPWSDQAKKWLGEARRKYGQGKGSRFEILKYVIARFGHPAVFDEALVPAYADCYDRLVQSMLVQSGLADGVVDTLERLFRLNLTINSATPTASVRESAFALGISRFFDQVLGGPDSKFENLSLAATCCVASPPAGMVFVGDGINDWKAAQKFGCHFIGVANSWNNWGKKRPKGMPKYCLITDLREIPDKIALLEKK